MATAIQKLAVRVSALEQRLVLTEEERASIVKLMAVLDKLEAAASATNDNLFPIDPDLNNI